MRPQRKYAEFSVLRNRPSYVLTIGAAKATPYKRIRKTRAAPPRTLNSGLWTRDYFTAITAEPVRKYSVPFEIAGVAIA